MSADRSELRDQLVEIFDGVEFPVSSRNAIERQLGPGDAYERIESGDFSMTLMSIGNAVSGGDVGDYPYEDAGALASAILDALDEMGRL